jgi:hypothetical protein
MTAGTQDVETTPWQNICGDFFFEANGQDRKQKSVCGGKFQVSRRIMEVYELSKAGEGLFCFLSQYFLPAKQ